MDLKQLECFIAVAEERHFTRAARRLNNETFVDLKRDWGMRRLLDRGFAALPGARTTAFEVNDVPTLLDLVAQGLGIALVPESIARARAEDARASPIAVAKLSDGAAPCWELVVAFKGHNGQPSDLVTKTFLDLLISKRGVPVRYQN
jgi:DNA-binding transcriptional LysR family regulator